MRWKNFDIPDQAILTYIENSARMLKKVRRLLGQQNRAKGIEQTTPEQRSACASHAAKARWGKQDKSDN